jgi:acetyl-CoA carboxylase carboxyl transferase subunit alpha
MVKSLKSSLLQALDKLDKKDADSLIERRYQRLMSYSSLEDIKK